MNKFLVAASLTAVLYSTGVSAQQDSIRQYVSKALDIMKHKSVNKSKVNWEELSRTTLNDVSKARTIKETYPVLKKALRSLDDSHSRFYPAEEVRQYTLGYKATGQEFPK